MQSHTTSVIVANTRLWLAARTALNCRLLFWKVQSVDNIQYVIWGFYFVSNPLQQMAAWSWDQSWGFFLLRGVSFPPSARLQGFVSLLRLLCIIAGSLPYNIKGLEATVIILKAYWSSTDGFYFETLNHTSLQSPRLVTARVRAGSTNKLKQDQI